MDHFVEYLLAKTTQVSEKWTVELEPDASDTCFIREFGAPQKGADASVA